MTAISICARLLLAAMVFLVIYLSRRKAQPKLAAFAAQRMCPHCGRITPRAGAACLECGEILTN